MKQFLLLLIASVLVGLACFVLFHFVFSVNIQDSISYAVAGGIGGLVGEYVRMYFSAHKKKKNRSLQ